MSPTKFLPSRLDISPNLWYNARMNHLNMTFETFCDEVLTSTPYNFSDDELREFYDDGHSVDDTVEYGEWKLDSELFPEYA